MPGTSAALPCHWPAVGDGTLAAGSAALATIEPLNDAARARAIGNNRMPPKDGKPHASDRLADRSDVVGERLDVRVRNGLRSLRHRAVEIAARARFEAAHLCDEILAR